MAAITSPDALEPYDITTVTFEDVANLDGQEFGFEAGQPYANLGLTFVAASVDANANLASFSGGVAVRSDDIRDQGLWENSLWWQFSLPQQAVGFYYRDSLATSFRVRAADANSNLLEENTFPGGEGYAGLIRANADILYGSVYAPHQTVEDAIAARAFVDDLSFAARLKKFTTDEPGNAVIVLGGVPADGGGFVIGPWGISPVPPSNPELKQAVIAANLLFQAEGIGNLAIREELKRAASSLMKAATESLLRLR